MRRPVQQTIDNTIFSVLGIFLPGILSLLKFEYSNYFTSEYHYFLAYISIVVYINGVYTLIFHFTKNSVFRIYFPIILIKNISVLIFTIIISIPITNSNALDSIYELFLYALVYINFFELINIVYNGLNSTTTNIAISDMIASLNLRLKKHRWSQAIIHHTNKTSAFIILLFFYRFLLETQEFKYILTMLVLVLILIYKPYIKKVEISIKLSNIVNEDLANTKIYRLSYIDTVFENSRLVKIDFSRVKPEKSKITNIELVNYSSTKSSVGVNDNPYFFICIPNKEKAQTYKLKIMLSYVQDSKKYSKKIICFLETSNYSSECMPYINTSMVISRRCSVHVLSLYDFFYYRTKKSKLYSPYNAIENTYYYDSDLYIDSLHEPIHDTRKFLEHDGSFGIGKTAYDIISLIENDRIPVVISPWEDHYDHDILYLIYKKLKKATKHKYNLFGLECYIFFLFMLLGVYTFIFANYKILYKMIYESQTFITLLQNNLMLYEVLYNKVIVFLILIPVLVYIVFTRVIAELIIFKRNYTKIYQSFFINQIYRMIINNPEIILLIEDIDRLNIDGMHNVFRTISAINKRFIHYNKPIGVLSYKISSVTKRSKMNDSGFKYTDIANKIVYGKYGKDFNNDKCMILFTEAILKYIERTEGVGQLDCITLVKRSVQNENFRTVHNHISILCNEMAKYHVKYGPKFRGEIEDIIKNSFDIKLNDNLNVI